MNFFFFYTIAFDTSYEPCHLLFVNYKIELYFSPIYLLQIAAKLSRTDMKQIIPGRNN